MKRLVFWLPPLVWMALILGLGSGEFSAERTSRWLEPLLQWLRPGAAPAQIDAVHGAVRKAAHVAAYAILAALWLRALRRERRVAPPVAAGGAFLIAVGWACVDEWRQTMTPARSGSPLDVGVDAVGALAAVTLGHHGWRRVTDVVTAILLWVAAVGGGAAITFNAVSGVGSGVLWVTVPAAALVLIARRRLASTRRRTAGR